jgi:hypothetical protein
MAGSSLLATCISLEKSRNVDKGVVSFNVEVLMNAVMIGVALKGA